MKFELLNVFTRDNQGGNQLAVVYPTRELSHERMQAIAIDFGFSETVFIHANRNIRIYTPVTELPFAGHPTVGATWSWSRHSQSSKFQLSTLKGILECQTEGDLSSVRFPGEVLIKSPASDVKEVLQQCEIPASVVDLENVRELNSGPEFLILPVSDHSTLQRAKPVTSLKGKARPYIVYRENARTFHVRMFSPYLKGGEDAATGSAACALAGWLREVMKEKKGEAKVYQGQELGRPSEIHLSWDENSIFIKGKSILWGEGRLID